MGLQARSYETKYQIGTRTQLLPIELAAPVNITSSPCRRYGRQFYIHHMAGRQNLPHRHTYVRQEIIVSRVMEVVVL